MILLIDNYDSFTYNIYQLFGELGARVEVVRNDEISVRDIGQSEADRIVISPGPGTPDDAGISCDVVRDLGTQLPILGICLGMQCIGQVYGGVVGRAKILLHGKASDIAHSGDGIFKGLPSPFKAGRYHSLVVEESTFPTEVLEVTARTSDGVLMGLRHRRLPTEGVQFHPESILTEHGATLLRNFLAAHPTFSNAI